tara:strand:- start:82 stop:495 length:414 start_codon:yes stop_codon:yes gene_type:complete
MEEKRKIKLLLDHLGSEVTHDYNDILNCDYCLCEETTADGYGIYTFLEPNEAPCISENVYYYNYDLGEKVVEALMEGNTVVFLDDYEYDYLDVQELLLGEFEELVEDILQDEELNINEIKELKDEYGIEEEEETETA